MPEQRNDQAAAKGSDKCLVCNRPRSEHINGQLCTRMGEAVKSAAQGRNWPRLLWLGWRWHFNVHRDEFCHLCFTVGPVGFRWHR